MFTSHTVLLTIAAGPLFTNKEQINESMLKFGDVQIYFRQNIFIH